jgi:predicted protein tyrosine phosphatase
MAKRVLFVCEGNLHRSPTAQRLYASTPGIKARSAGLSSLARVQLTEELLAWADIIFVMERRLVGMIRNRFRAAVADKEVVCLAIPDDYQFMQAELQSVLVERLTPYLGKPAEPDP